MKSGELVIFGNPMSDGKSFGSWIVGTDLGRAKSSSHLWVDASGDLTKPLLYEVYPPKQQELRATRERREMLESLNDPRIVFMARWLNFLEEQKRKREEERRELDRTLADRLKAKVRKRW